MLSVSIPNTAAHIQAVRTFLGAWLIVAALCIEVIWHEDNCEQSILRCAAQAACAPLLVAALQGYRSICWEAWQSELMLDLSPPTQRTSSALRSPQ